MFRRHPLIVVTVLSALMITPWFATADQGDAEYPTAQRLFEEGLQQYASGDVTAARATFKRVDPAQLPKEQRVKLREVMDELDKPADVQNAAVAQTGENQVETEAPVADVESAPVEPDAPAAVEPATAADAPADAAEANNDVLAQARRLRAQERLAEGRVAEQEGRYRVAAQLYEEATRLDPQNADARAALSAVQTRVAQDEAPRSVLESQVESIELRNAATIAEFRELMNRADALRARGNYSAALEAVSQAKLTLDRSERWLPTARYRTLREESVTVAARIADEQRLAEGKQQRQIEEIRAREAEETRRVALEAQEEEVQRLLVRARNLQTEQRYDQALETVNQALFFDPNNVAAQMMKQMIEDAQVFVQAKDLMRQRSLEIARQGVQGIENSIPFNELITYPADWPQLTVRRLGNLELDAGESRVNQQVTQRLREPVPIDFQANKLVNVIDYLRNTTGLNFFVNWNALQQVGVEQDAPISLQLANVPVDQALRLVLQQVSIDELNPVGFSVIEGIVTISTQRDLTRTTDTRVFDIRDLLHRIDPVPNVPRFDLTSALEAGAGQGSSGASGTTTSIFGGAGTVAPDPAAEAQALIDELLTLIQDTVGSPEEWAANGGTVSSVRELNGNLIVRTTPQNHRGVVELLSQLRETRAMQINVEGRFLLVDQNFLEEVGVDLDVQIDNPGANFGPIKIGQDSANIASRPSTGFPGEFTGGSGIGGLGAFVPGDGFNDTGRSLDIGVTYLDDLQVNLLIRATQAQRRSISLTAPRVTFLNGQEAFVTVARQIAFISDLVPIPGGTGFDPTLSVIQSGTILYVRGTVSADRRYVTLTIRPSLATVIQPIRTVEIVGTVASTDTGGGSDTVGTISGTLDVPTLELTSVETNVTVPDRGTLLLGGQRLVGESEVEAGVPVLSKIPVLNRLFTNRTSVKDERTLLILVKPTIIIQTEEEDDLFPGLLQNPAQYGASRGFN